MPRVEIEIRATGVDDALSAFQRIGAAAESAGSSMKRIFEAATGVTIATTFTQAAVQVVNFTKEMITLGIEVSRATESFNAMAASVGQSGAAIEASMTRASRGLLDFTDVARQVGVALTEGLRPDVLEQFAEGAIAQSRKVGVTVTEMTNLLIQAWLRADERALRSAGIYVDLTEEIEKYARAEGQAAKDITEAGRQYVAQQVILRELAKSQRELGTEVDTLGQRAERLNVSWRQLREGFATLTVTAIDELATAFANLSQKLEPAAVSFVNAINNMKNAVFGTEIPTNLTAEGIRNLGSAASKAPQDLGKLKDSVDRFGVSLKGTEPHFKANEQAMTKMAKDADALAALMDKAAQKFALLFVPESARGAVETAMAWEAMAQAAEKLGAGGAAAAEQLRGMGAAAVELAVNQQALKQQWTEMQAAADLTATAIENVTAAITLLGQLQNPAEAVINGLTETAERASFAEQALDELVGAAGRVGFTLTEGSRAVVTFGEVWATATMHVEEFTEAIGGVALPAVETQIRNMTGALEAMIANGLDPASDAAEGMRTALRTLRDLDMAAELEEIALKAELLGDNFDAMGARVALARRNFDEIVAAWRDGTATLEDVRAAAQRLNDTLGDQKVYDTVVAGWDSVVGAISKSIEGVIQGTQSMADAVTNAFRNMGLGILDFFLKEILDPLKKEFASFARDIWQMLSGRGGGATSLIGQFLGIGGAGGAGGEWVEGPTGLREWQPTRAGGGGGGGFGGIVDIGMTVGKGIIELPSILSAATQAWEAFNISLRVGAGVTESLSAGFSTFTGNIGANLSALSIYASAIGAVYQLYTGISALAEGRTGTGVGTLAGMAVGGGIGFIAGGPVGALFGAVIGGFLGGQAGGFFDEDWEMIHKLRAQQRHRTALTALSETTGRLMAAPSTAGLIEQFQKPIIGTETTTGGVLLEMARSGLAGNIQFEGDLTFTLPEATATTIIDFLQKAGFTPEQFDSGRVNSITELIAATGQGDIGQGIEDWQTFMEGLAAFIKTVTATQETLTELKEFDWTAVAGDSDKMADALVENGLAIINAIRVAGTLGEAGFGAAAENIRKQVAEIVTAFGPFDVVMGKVQEALTAAAIQDPRILVAILDMSKFQRAGEDINETSQRVAEALGGLAELMAKLRQATRTVDIDRMSDDLAKAMTKTSTAMEEMKTKLGEATDPSDILAYAETLVGLTEAYYQMQIDLATQLVEIIRTNVEAVVNTARNIATHAEFLERIGVDIRGAMESMIGFAASLDVDLPSKMAAIGGAFDLFMVEFKQALKAPDLAAALSGLVAPGGDLLGTIQEAFTAAMQLTDPNAQVEALNGLLDMLGGGVQAIIQALAASGLSEDQQKAILQPILDSIGPLGRQIYDALVTASKEQARQAQLAQEELTQIMGNQAMNYQNFVALKLGEMTDAMKQTLGLLETAIRNLSERGFGDMAADMNAIRRILEGTVSAQTGLVHVPSTGLYHLHEGEMVLNPEAAAHMRASGMAGSLARGGAMGFQRVELAGGTATAIREMARSIDEMADVIVAAIRNLSEGGFMQWAAAIKGMADNVVAAIRNLSETGFLGLADLLRGMAADLATIATGMSGAADALGQILSAMTSVPSAQTGIENVPETGLYELHEGEMVLNKEAAARFRASPLSAMFDLGGAVGFQKVTLVGDVASAIRVIAAEIRDMSNVVVAAIRNLSEAGFMAWASSMKHMADVIVQAINNLSETGFLGLADLLRGMAADISSMARGMDAAADALGAIYSAMVAIPAAQGGMHGVGRTGLAVIHEGEMILNPRAAGVARGLGLSNEMLEAGAVRAFQEGEDRYVRGINVRTGESSYSPWAQAQRARERSISEDPEVREARKQAAIAYYEGVAAMNRTSQAASDAAGEVADAFAEAAEAIGNVARTLSQHADLLKEAGISLAGLADPMFAWSAQLPTLASQMAAFSGAASLLEAELRQTEDAWGTLVRVGPHALNAVRDLTQAAVGLSDADPKAKLEGLTGAFDAIAGGIKMAQGAVSEQYDRMRQAAEDAGQAQEEAIDLQRQAMDDQIDALNDLVQSSEDWARVAESIADQLLELRTGPLGSPNPSERFAAARGAFDVAMAAFRAAPTAEGAANVQELARAVLEAASEFMTRPSPQYQGLFAEITAALEDVREVAESRGVNQEELLQQIAALEEQSRQLDTQRNQIQEQTRQAIERLNADEKVALQAIANTFSAELRTLVTEMQRVSVAAALQTTGQQSQTDVAVQSLARLGEISQASSYSASTIGAIAGAMGAAQEGAWRTHAGLYALHEDEMVLPKAVAAGVRSGGGLGGGGVTFHIGAVHVTGSREGAREFFDELETLTERSIRYGKLRRVLQRETP
jgi:hypothetical protein